MKIRELTFAAAFLLLLPGTAVSEEGYQEGTAINGSGCETIRGDESKSTARVRATDKATFSAVSKLRQLDTYREQLDNHDFNVMVYSIVDDYVEDLSIKTTQQSENKICVEVNGYVNNENIGKAIDGTLEKQAAEEDINNHIEEDKVPELSDEITKQLEQAPAVQTSGPEAVPDTQPQPAAEASFKQGLVYIAPTEFFNNTQSSEHSKILKNWFAEKGDFLVTDKPELADYTIKTKVLRAKVDAINNTSSRLQMVISEELIFADGKSPKTVHQNRFVLIDENEDEQQAAYKLLKKLFENAAEQLSIYMRQDDLKKGYSRDTGMLPEVITPAGLRHPRPGELSNPKL